jgi:hypothetical protein
MQFLDHQEIIRASLNSPNKVANPSLIPLCLILPLLSLETTLEAGLAICLWMSAHKFWNIFKYLAPSLEFIKSSLDIFTLPSFFLEPKDEFS